MYILTVALRHLLSRPVCWVAAACVAAVATLYLLVVSVTEGFTEHWMDALRSVSSDMTVRYGHIPDAFYRPETYTARLARIPGVRGATARLEIPAVVQFDRGRTVASLYGIDLARELKVGRLKEALPTGLRKFGKFEHEGSWLSGAVVGNEWRTRFELRVGDLATFLFTDREGNAKAKQFEIVGFFKSKNELLNRGAYVDRETLARKLGYPRCAKTLAVWLDDPETKRLKELKSKVKAVMRELLFGDEKPEARLLAPLEVGTWQEMDNNYYQALERQNVIMRFIMGLFLLFVGFVLFLIFGRLVAEKVRDIGVLRALGATPSGVCGCFLTQGLLIAAVGLAVGLPAAWWLIGHVNWVATAFGVDVFPKASFLIDRIPTRPLGELSRDTALIVGATFFTALLGAFWPAWRAARLNPVECLRHE